MPLLAIDPERSTELVHSLHVLSSESEGVIDLIRAAENLSEISTGVVGRISDIGATGSAVSRAVAEATAKAQGFRLPLEAGLRPSQLAHASRIRRARRQVGPGSGSSPTTYEGGPTRLEGPRLPTSIPPGDDPAAIAQTRKDLLAAIGSGAPHAHDNWLGRAMRLEATARGIDATRTAAPAFELRWGSVIPSARHWTTWAAADSIPRAKVAVASRTGRAAQGVATAARGVGRTASVIGGVLTITEIYGDGRAEWVSSNGDARSTTAAVVRSTVAEGIDTAVVAGAGGACGLIFGTFGAGVCGGLASHYGDGTGDRVIDAAEDLTIEASHEFEERVIAPLNGTDITDHRGLGDRIVDLLDVRPGR